MLMRRWFTLGIVCLAVCGCEPPAAIVSSAPPGTDPLRKLPDSEKNTPAEALGEQAAAARPGAKADAKSTEAAAIPAAVPTAKGETKTTASGVKYETLTEGTGAEAKSGQMVSVHYTGTLENGNKFDSSRDRGVPFEFTIGQGNVIRGWDEAIPGMKVGERRKLTIPASAGYGTRAQESIPPNSTLIFDVELVGIK
ncbi:FKBP-type peptidyl-prolyl cis-trans isomerase FkpA [Singulisphaera sp. GP187]|uniref:FKBP-type peptidyl-prolyl cis-trans isomerase n=1 Tax=Singulisphaera sp. GP187 TaxID=1882752 RepID=UPI0009271CE1|nr:FKBP-type peptidyl-prolyl cis-trans isomerase [Singulisphaera sp. GP187]SIO07036.1 FKBP-type peptidyl-prolyl cis-trans isomerase FkpA [Singulisphaera sp. GP187]